MQPLYMYVSAICIPINHTGDKFEQAVIWPVRIYLLNAIHLPICRICSLEIVLEERSFAGKGDIWQQNVN